MRQAAASAAAQRRVAADMRRASRPAWPAPIVEPGLPRYGQPNSGLQPAALGGDQDRLRAVGGAHLAIGGVQVAADRARRDAQRDGDLLVELALGEAAQRLEL